MANKLIRVRYIYQAKDTDCMEGNDAIVTHDGNYKRYRYVICRDCEQGRWVPVSEIAKESYTGLCRACWRRRLRASHEELLAILKTTRKV